MTSNYTATALDLMFNVTGINLFIIRFDDTQESRLEFRFDRANEILPLDLNKQNLFLNRNGLVSHLYNLKILQTKLVILIW